MEPNYTDGQVFNIVEISPDKLKRGDIILFTTDYFSTENKEEYLKRIIGLPKETVEINDGQVFINGEPLEEPYKIIPPSYTEYKITLKEDEFYVLGDNREGSSDSHNFGPIKSSDIIGKAIPIK